MPIPDILRELESSSHFLVTVHVNPDGDAIGALLGMTSFIEALGKRVVPVIPDPVPPRYTFLPGSDKVRTIAQAEREAPYDAIVILDAGDYDRIGDVAKLRQAGMRVVNIDHHISNVQYGDASWIDTGASATCEMLVDLYREAKVPITPEIANQLYTGIMTDTGRFRFSNTTAKVFATCANLVSRGADPVLIAESIYYRTEAQTMLSMGRVLTKIQFFEKERIAFSYLDPEEQGADTEGFIDKLMSIDSVEIAILLRPIGEDLWKASFRTNGDVDLSALATAFNGGGHAKAAGGKVAGPIDQAKQQVVEACRTALLKNQG